MPEKSGTLIYFNDRSIGYALDSHSRPSHHKIPSMSGILNLLLRGILPGLVIGGAHASAAPGRGETIYLEKCAMCHLPSGQGAPPAFPPLAGSDWLAANRTGAIRTICEGMEGPVIVNGRRYNNVMPAQMLDDAAVAEVLTYVTSAWGNQGQPYTADEVRETRAKTRFPTYADLEKAAAYPPLPTAPPGWKLQEVAPLPVLSTRLASDRKGGTLYVMGERGTVHRLINGTVTPWIYPEQYADLSKGTLSTMGLALGPGNRLWLVSNQKTEGPQGVDDNFVTIWRSDPISGDTPPALKPFTTVRYPWGVGPFNHGVSHLAFGPDQMLYVSSGSRTDGGEPGNQPNISTVGETPLTASLWRLDPGEPDKRMQILAMGLRNAYGFDWNELGELFTVSNGPDANAPEEMDFIQPGNHYGFPYQFSVWDRDRKLYPHTPEAPEGLAFTHPLVNEGPAGGGGIAGGLGTFDPHSSPGGIVWCGKEYAEPLRSSFIVPRFGNLLPVPQDAGFDVLRVQPYRDKTTGLWQAKVTTLLAPMGRPLDVHPDGKGGIYILEYTRPTSFQSRIGWLPGRILQLKPAS